MNERMKKGRSGRDQREETTFYPSSEWESSEETDDNRKGSL